MNRQIDGFKRCSFTNKTRTRSSLGILLQDGVSGQPVTGESHVFGMNQFVLIGVKVRGCGIEDSGVYLKSRHCQHVWLGGS